MTEIHNADIAARLIAFDTVSHRSNVAIADYIAEYLGRYGIASRRFPNAAGDKVALLATIGSPNRPGLCLSGHLDVVPVEGQPWSRAPFDAWIDNGRLYGRGATDMKGFVAVLLKLVPTLVAMRDVLPVHLCLSYDEEITCRGSLDLIQAFGTDLPRPIGCIVGEPTLMKVVNAHKSLATFETTVSGTAGHSSRPEDGVNAVFAAARLVSELERIGEALRQIGDPSGKFDPAYSSLSVGTFHGGNAVNVIPDRAAFRWETRSLPGVSSADVLSRLDDFAHQRILPQFPDTVIDTIPGVEVPALAPSTDDALEKLAVAVSGRGAAQAVSYGTEAGHFDAAGIPTIVCGPGSIAQAHKADEWIELEQLRACESFLLEMVARLSAS